MADCVFLLLLPYIKKEFGELKNKFKKIILSE